MHVEGAQSAREIVADEMADYTVNSAILNLRKAKTSNSSCPTTDIHWLTVRSSCLSPFVSTLRFAIGTCSGGRRNETSDEQVTEGSKDSCH